MNCLHTEARICGQPKCKHCGHDMAEGSVAPTCSVTHVLCKTIGHKWRSRNHRPKHNTHQACKRCGMWRDYTGTSGHGCHLDPYWPNDERTPTMINESYIEELPDDMSKHLADFCDQHDT